MIQTINDLRSSEKELIKKVREKDKEIKEYKEEGGKIALSKFCIIIIMYFLLQAFAL